MPCASTVTATQSVIAIYPFHLLNRRNNAAVYETAFPLELLGNAMFLEHRDAVFNPRYKNLAMVALPIILVFPDDIALSGTIGRCGFIVEPFCLPAGAVLTFEKEDFKKLVWMVPHRLVYRQLMYYILIKLLNGSCRAGAH